MTARWFALLLAACNPTGVKPGIFVCPEVIDSTEIIESQFPPIVDASQAAFTQELSVDPDARLLPFVQESSDRYADRLGLSITTAIGGIPIVVRDEVTYMGSPVDAIAHYKKLCVFDECQPSLTYIAIAAPLLDEKQWAMQQTMDHELGHVVSGWGSAIGWPQHFKESGHLMSPGCVNHVCAPWTAEDATMLCAGAPCTKIDLP